MAWIESHQSLGTHRKTKALKRILRIKTPQAVGHLHLLWWWCLDNAPDGSLEGIDDADLSDAAEWPGKPETFVKALAAAGFVDENTRELHDWHAYAGKLIDRRKANAQRQQAHRNALRNDDVTVTSPPRNGATIPTVTKQPTGPTQTDPINRNNGGAAVFGLYEQEIGSLTPFISSGLQDALDFYGAERLLFAVREASRQGVKKWSYIEAILKNGPEEDRPAGGNGEGLIGGRWTLETCRAIAEGRTAALKANREIARQELKKRGIEFEMPAGEAG
jgi:DnaD/phage-associated family protein